jgi:hypothetical protein
MIPEYNLHDDGVAYVPSLAVPNRTLLTICENRPPCPLSQKDLYVLQRLSIPEGQVWSILCSGPEGTHVRKVSIVPGFSHIPILMAPRLDAPMLPPQPEPTSAPPPLPPPSQTPSSSGQPPLSDGFEATGSDFCPTES